MFTTSSRPSSRCDFFSQQRIVGTDAGVGTRVNRHNAVVFGDLLRKSKDFVFPCVAVRFVHEAEGTAEGSALHGLADIAEFPFNLGRGIRRRVIARHAGPD